MERFCQNLQIDQISPSGFISTREDFVINEERIAFYLNGEKLLSVMSVPVEQDYHIVGFLMSEGVISNISQIDSIKIAEDGKSVWLEAQIHQEMRKNLFREKTRTSGCGVGVAGNLEGNVIKKFIANPYKVTTKKIFEHLREFEENSLLFSKTGCVHKAMLSLKEKTPFPEDIGRHKVLNKMMVKARLQGLIFENSCFLERGR